ncbi:MAG: alpha-ketoglutarate-dependent dioxygenase AlkB, partial [Methylococcales bacterium]
MYPLTKNLAPIDGELYLIKQFYPQAEADRLFTVLSTELAWQEESLLIFGRYCKVPRLMCWYGDDTAHYPYSGVKHSPKAWTAELQSIRAQIQQQCTTEFN